jgi:hypothetical protein
VVFGNYVGDADAAAGGQDAEHFGEHGGLVGGQVDDAVGDHDVHGRPLTAPARVREHQMSKIAEISEPASELEHLIAELPESGLLVFVFSVGWWTAHLKEYLLTQ